MDQLESRLDCAGCLKRDSVVGVVWVLSCEDNPIRSRLIAVVFFQDQPHLCVMACGKRRLAKVLEGEVRLSRVIEIKEVDLARRIQRNICLLYTSPSPRD